MMAVNVTEKDKTLNEIIDWCEQMEANGLRLASALLMQHDMAAYGVMQGQISAYEQTPTTAVPCSATAVSCLPKYRIKARTRIEHRRTGSQTNISSRIPIRFAGSLHAWTRSTTHECRDRGRGEKTVLPLTPATPDQRACQMAKQLNKEKS